MVSQSCKFLRPDGLRPLVDESLEECVKRLQAYRSHPAFKFSLADFFHLPDPFPGLVLPVPYILERDPVSVRLEFRLVESIACRQDTRLVNVEEDVKDLLDRMEPLVRLFDPPGQLEEVNDLVQRDSTQTARTLVITRVGRPASSTGQLSICSLETGSTVNIVSPLLFRPVVSDDDCRSIAPLLII